MTSYANQAIDEPLRLLQEISEYLNDTHPQGAHDALKVNTISSTSTFHIQIQQAITDLKNKLG